jgi:hypothetical protein
MASKDNKCKHAKDQWEEEEADESTAPKKQRMNGDDNGNDDDGESSSSTNDFSSKPEEEVSSKEEMIRRACYNDGDTYKLGEQRLHRKWWERRWKRSVLQLGLWLVN